MKKHFTFAFVIVALCSLTTNAAVIFDWATIGNPGNGGDQQPQGTFGAVDYTYRISKHEVRNAQYTEFLNAVDPMGSNSLALYDSNMSSNASGGINFVGGAANGSKYQVKAGRDNNPVNFVSFFDAMRFVNWLENGQGSGGTESGTYTIGNGIDETRNPSATYFIPSENEWYKAAYHKNDGVTANYWQYLTSTDAIPYSDQPPGSGAPTQSNTANVRFNDGIANGYNDGFAVTGSDNTSNTQNYLTDVGAYSASMSPYGTFDQGGNVFEWNERVHGSFPFRGHRGGGFDFGSLGALHASSRSATMGEFPDGGFRVAGIGVPEPGSLLLGMLGTFALLVRKQRRV